MHTHTRVSRTGSGGLGNGRVGCEKLVGGGKPHASPNPRTHARMHVPVGGVHLEAHLEPVEHVLHARLLSHRQVVLRLGVQHLYWSDGESSGWC